MILIDTGLYVAYLNKRDQKSQQARSLARAMLSGDFGARFTISELFSEVATLLYRRTKNKTLVQKAWNLFYSEKHAWGQSIIITKEYIDIAWKIFQSHVSPKRKLSFVDCLLIAFAQKNNISNILSFDEQFDGILVRIH